MRGIGEAKPQAQDGAFEVLWAGEHLEALDALKARGVRISRVPAERCADQVRARAPDLIVLSGSAARVADTVVVELREHYADALPPIIVISADEKTVRVHQRRAGLLTSFGFGLSAAELAGKIHGCLEELAAASSPVELMMESGDIDGWLKHAARDGICGFLITHDSVGVIALGPEGQSCPVPRTPPAAHASPARGAMKFRELPPSRLRVLGTPHQSTGAPELASARVLVLHPDPSRAQALQAALSAAGADATALSSVDPTRVSSFGPTLIVVATSALCLEGAASLWDDARLASVSWLVLDDATDPPLDPAQLVGPAAALVAEQRALQQSLAEGELLLGRIERFGPTGWLKEVGRCQQPVTLLLIGAQGRAELSLANGKISSAKFAASDAGALHEGRAALQALLAMPYGRVLVGPHDRVLALETSLRTPLSMPPAPSAPAPSQHSPSQRSVPVAPVSRTEPPSGAKVSGRVTPPLPSASPSPAVSARVAPIVPATVTAPVPRVAAAAAPAPSVLAGFDPGLLTKMSAPDAPSAAVPVAPLVSRPAVPAAPVAPTTPVVPTPARRIEPADDGPAQPRNAAMLERTPEQVASLPAPEIEARRGSSTSMSLGLALALAAAGLVFAFVRPEPSEHMPRAAAQLHTAARSPHAVPTPVHAEMPEPPPLVARGTAAVAPAEPPEDSAQPADAEPVDARPMPSEKAVPTPIRRGSEAALLLERAKKARDESRYEQAEELLKDVLLQHPNDSAARYHMALTLAKLRRFSAAHAELAKALELNATSAHSWLLEGDIFSQEGFRPQAIRAWTRCLEVRPEFPTCEERLARWTKHGTRTD